MNDVTTRLFVGIVTRLARPIDWSRKRPWAASLFAGLIVGAVTLVIRAVGGAGISAALADGLAGGLGFIFVWRFAVWGIESGFFANSGRPGSPFP